jgi:predicted DNA-binding transcriptional regulator AlpA
MMKFLRYPDLVEMNVVRSRMTLKRLIDSQGFPPGRLITPNSRAWTDEEVIEWLDNRPVAKKAENRVVSENAEAA